MPLYTAGMMWWIYLLFAWLGRKMTVSGYKSNAYSLAWLAAGLLILDDANERSKTSWRQGSSSQILWWHSVLAVETIINIRTALKIATRTTKLRPEVFLEAEGLERAIVPVYLVTSPTILYGEKLHALIRRVRCAVLAYLPPRGVLAFEGVSEQETPRFEVKLVRFLMILRPAIFSWLMSLLAYLIFPSGTSLTIQLYIVARRTSRDRDHSLGGLSALFCHYALEIGDIYYELDRTGWIMDTIRLSKSHINPKDSSRTILSKVYCGETSFTEREITARGKNAQILLQRIHSDCSKPRNLSPSHQGTSQCSIIVSLWPLTCLIASRTIAGMALQGRAPDTGTSIGILFWSSLCMSGQSGYSKALVASSGR